MVPARPFFNGNDGWVRSSAWIWDFSSMHSTTARSGGFRYQPDHIDQLVFEAWVARHRRGQTEVA